MTLDRALARSLKRESAVRSKSPEKKKEKAKHLLLGERGEDLAVDFLLAKEFRILERNVRYKWGEIDIVAKQGNVVVFAEVRTRRIGKVMPAALTVGPDKLRKLEMCAQAWAESCHYLGYMRIDLIAITVSNEEENVKIEHYENITEAII